MLQRISLGRWNLGEASQRSIGDHDLEEYPLTARYVENFIVNDQAKISRRPGFVFQDEIAEHPGRLIPFYMADTTYIFHFYIDGVELYFKIYSMQDSAFGKRLTASADSTLVYTYTEDDFNQHPIPGVAINGAPFPHAPIPDIEILSEYLKLLSFVQVREHIYLTQKYMQYPVHIFYDETGDYVTGGGWACLNYLDEHDLTGSYITNYVDVHWDLTNSVWLKTVQPNLTTGGGNMDYTDPANPTPLGFMYYTGNKPTNRYEENPKTLEYLTGVTFIFNRLVWVRENVMNCTTNGDETQIGWQLRPETDDYDPNKATEIPPEVLASDAFATQIGSDLGHENLFWVSSGKALLGGANNGMWILSNNQAGGLNAVNPQNYKTIADGIHWVPGKSIGDAFVYFQKPGNIMKEMVYSDNMQGYQAITLNYFADHIYESAKPTELVIQRSPFNIAWTLDESGAIAAMTYDRVQNVRGWSRCKFGTMYEKYNNESAKAHSIAVFAENNRDRLAAIIEREDGNYLELMDITGKGVDESLYLDSSSILSLKSAVVTDLEAEPSKEVKIFCENTFEVDDYVRFKGFTLADYGAESFIYGIWKVVEADPTYIKVVDAFNIEYEGTVDYEALGIVEKVYDNLPIELVNALPSLHDKHLKVVLDKIPYNVYLTSDGRLLDTTVEVEEGEEFPELGIAWNKIEIGFGYESIFSPYIIKKQLHRAKINEIELELYKSFGGKIGIADLTWDYKLKMIRMVDLTYPTTYDIEKTYTGTIKPAIVGGYSDEPLWFLYISDGTPLNLSNVIFYLEAR